MGAYSDAFLLTGPQAELLFNKRLGEEPDPVVNDAILNFVHGSELFAKDGWTLRMWEGIKWYDDYGVQFLQDFMDDLCARAGGADALPDGFRFVRVGETLTEEDADLSIEEQLEADPPDDLYIVVRMVAKTLGGPNERFLGSHSNLSRT